MGRSVTFVIESVVPTRVRISENLDGTLSFELECLGGAPIDALRALFFDLNDFDLGESFAIYADAGVCEHQVVVEGADTLGRSARVRGAVVNEFGDFDIGIDFAPGRPSDARPRATGLTLAHASEALTLDLIDLADFGLRYAAGKVDDRSGAVAGPGGSGEAMVVFDSPPAGVDLLASSADGGILAVIDVNGAAALGEDRRGRDDPRHPGCQHDAGRYGGAVPR